MERVKRFGQSRNDQRRTLSNRLTAFWQEDLTRMLFLSLALKPERAQSAFSQPGKEPRPGPDRPRHARRDEFGGETPPLLRSRAITLSAGAIRSLADTRRASRTRSGLVCHARGSHLRPRHRALARRLTSGVYGKADGRNRPAFGRGPPGLMAPHRILITEPRPQSPGSSIRMP